MSQLQTDPSSRSLSGKTSDEMSGASDASEIGREIIRMVPNRPRPPARAAPASGIEKQLLRQMLESIGDPPLQLVLWDGDAIPMRSPDCVARVLVRDRGALWRLVTDPGLQFGEMYSTQRIDVDGDLTTMLEALYRSLPRNGRRSLGQKLLAPFQDTQRTTRTTRAGASHSIEDHYNLGNDFYKLWLDRQMIYTCAFFPSSTTGLEEAQIAKLDRVCRKLRLKPGDAVVEAGCGWGALALHMARNYGVKVKAYNISSAQISYAQKRAHAQGLDHLVEFIQDDYRAIRGDFDAFVSVGMLEHVGTEHYQELGAVIGNSLKDHGMGLIHSIGRDAPRPLDAWIRRHIFPGACPPSLSQMTGIFEPFGFSVLDVENLRLHYAKTLEHWLQRFDAAAERIEKMFDAEFVRIWRLYLAGSAAAFRGGNMQLFQVLFAPARSNRIPWSRDQA